MGRKGHSGTGHEPFKENDNGETTAVKSDLLGVLPEDAPKDSPAWTRVKYDPGHNRMLFYHDMGGKKRVPFKTTLMTLGGSRFAAEVIARACFVKFEQGCSKDDVIAFRKECYDKIIIALDNDPSLLDPASGADEAPRGKIANGDKTATAPVPTKTQDQDNDQDTSASSDADSMEVDNSANGAEDAEAREDASMQSDDGSSNINSSSSSSDGEDESDNSREEEGVSSNPAVITLKPKSFGRVAAKMSVRSSLRCYCCYEKVCQRSRRKEEVG